MLRREFEVVVCAQKHEVVSYAQLRKQGIDCTDLDSRPATCVAKFRSGDMILTPRLKQRKRSKPLDDLRAGLCTGETLQQLLQHKPCRDDDICAQEGIPELLYLRLGSGGITPQCERPNARVYQQGHARDRSAL